MNKESLERGREVDAIFDSRVIDFIRILKILYAKKKGICVVITFFIVSGVTYSLILPNVYKAEALLAPISDVEGSQVNALTSRLSGPANLAGVNLDKTETNKVTIALNALRSRQFITEFIKRHNLKVLLFATKGWNEETESWDIDNDIFDVSTKTWKIYFSKGVLGPTDWMAYREFSEYIDVTQDSETGLIKLSVRSLSPLYAKLWAEFLINDINDYMRKRDIEEAKRSIDYLNKQLKLNTVAEIRNMLFQLVVQQHKTIMLAEVRDGYVFKIIDRPVSPDDRFSPKRKIIVLLFFVFGSIFSVLVFLIVESPLVKSIRETG